MPIYPNLKQLIWPEISQPNKKRKKKKYLSISQYDAPTFVKSPFYILVFIIYIP